MFDSSIKDDDLGPWRCLKDCTTVAEQINAVWGSVEGQPQWLRECREAVLKTVRKVKVARVAAAGPSCRTSRTRYALVYVLPDGASFFGAEPLRDEEVKSALESWEDGTPTRELMPLASICCRSRR